MRASVVLAMLGLILPVLGAANPAQAAVADAAQIATESSSPKPNARRRAEPEASSEPSPALQPEVDGLGWTELWAVPFRFERADSGGRGQIAVRGPVVVAAASREAQDGSEDLSGIFVIDGRSEQQRRDAKVGGLDRVVRRIRVPGDAALGLALDADHVAFLSGEGRVVRARLDGLITWSVEVHGERAGLPAFFDLNADGVSDVLVPVAQATGKAAAQAFGILALEAKTGRALWSAGEPPTLLDRKGATPSTSVQEASLARLSVGPASGSATAAITVTENDVARLTVSLTRRGSVSVERRPERRAGDLPDAFPLRWHTAAGIIPPPVVPTEIQGALWFADAWQSAVWLVESRARDVCELWVTTADLAETPRRLSWPGACGSLPSIGNVNDDDLWDVVLAVDGKLRALSTDIRGDVALPLPRGDLQASGTLPAARESILSYKRMLPPRDRDWWLRPVTPTAMEGQAYAALPDVLLERENSDGSTRFAQESDAAPLPSQPETPDAHSHADLDGRRAGINAAGVTVCWRDEPCRAAPAASDAVLVQLAFEPETERLWGLAEDGRVFALEPGAEQWTNAGVVPTQRDQGADAPKATRVRALRAFSDKLVILRSSDFVVLQIDGPSVEPPSVTVPLSIVDVVRCGGRWFANNEGRLVIPQTADLARWTAVPDRPGPLRSLGCTSDGDARFSIADGSQFVELPSPSGSPEVPPAAWYVLAGAVVALVGVMLLPFRTGPTPPDPKAPVARHWRKDVPVRQIDRTLGDHRVLVDALLDFIDNPGTAPPVTVAVCGSWGSGKSSVMGVLHDELHKTGRYLLVWFNAWRFHRESEITHAFYQSILDEFRAQASSSIKFRVLLNRVRRAGVAGVTAFVVSSVLALIAVALLGMIFYGALKTEKTSVPSVLAIIPTALAVVFGVWRRGINPILKVVNVDTGKVLEHLQGRVRFVRDLKSEFETVFSGLNGALRLVVCVDDLDRCPPDRVADMLEALNALSDTGHTILVLAIDPTAVERAVHVRFADMIRVMRRQGAEKEATSFGSRYLEKMVTVSVNIPELSARDVMATAQRVPRAQPAAERQPWYRQNWRAIRSRVLRRVPVALTLAALLVALWPLQRLQLDLNWRGVEQFSEQMYAWCKHFAAASGSPAPVARGGVEPPAQGVVENQIRDPRLAEPGKAATPAGATSATSALVGRAAGAGNNRDRMLVLPRQSAPVVASPLDPPQIADVGESIAAGELRRLVLLALAVCGYLLVLGGFARVAARLEQTVGGRPATSDPEDFVAALQEASGQLPAHPRTAIRFENLARFVYHLVRRREQWRAGDEHHFFRYLIFRTFGRGSSDDVPDWLQQSIDAWVGRMDVRDQAASAEQNHDSGVRASAAPPAA